MSPSTTRTKPRTAPTLRPSLKRNPPGTRHERELWDDGHRIVVGMDEVGRGAWAGPLTLGAVVIPRDRRLTKVRDSKMLTAAERAVMFDRIVDWCDAWAVGHATHEECDELGMSAAQRLAARRAIEGLGVAPDRVLAEADEHPWWSFETNKGYPCPRHKTALAGVGPSAIHRRSWVFMEHLPWPGAVRAVPRHLRVDDSQGTLFG